MKASLVLSAAWFACLCFLSLARQTGATAASLASHPSINKNAEERGFCYTGTPGSATERSFFGWKLVGLKMVTPSRGLVERHYEEHVGKLFFEELLDYMCSGPVVAMVWEGTNVIAGGRKMLGATNPLDAEAGTIRGDMCTNAGRNLVHASDGPESARREIELWFGQEEVAPWNRATDPWISKNLS